MLAQLTMISSTTLRARFVTSGERAEGCSAGSLGSPMASLVRFQTSTTCWRMAERLKLREGSRRRGGCREGSEEGRPERASETMKTGLTFRRRPRAGGCVFERAPAVAAMGDPASRPDSAGAACGVGGTVPLCSVSIGAGGRTAAARPCPAPPTPVSSPRRTGGELPSPAFSGRPAWSSGECTQQNLGSS